MMNDAMMQMKSRHNNISSHLTGLARQATTLRRICNPAQQNRGFAIHTPADLTHRAILLVSLLLCLVSGAWGQVTLIGKGVIDEFNLRDYNTIKNNYPVSVSLTDITSWPGSGDMPSNHSEHWNGTDDYYADKYSSNPLDRTLHYKSTQLTLNKGCYTIMTAGRGSSGVELFMNVGDIEVSMQGVGNTGKGITTSGVASFTDGTFAHNNDGWGWKYFYIIFNVPNDNTNVTITVSGSSTAGGKWMSFTTPFLYKSKFVPNDNSGNPNGVFNETITGETYTVDGNALEFHGVDNCQYIRFYLVDNETNTPVAFPNIVSTAGSTFRDYGQLGKAVNSSNFLSGNNFIITLPYKTSYSLYCYMSNTALSQSNDGYDLEPTINTIFKFNITKQYTYAGSLLSHTTPQTIEVPVEAQDRYFKTLTELSDDFNAIVTGLSAEGTMLTTDMLKEANGYGATATQGNTATNCAYVLNNSTGQPYGDGGVINYADLSAYAKLVVTVTEGTPRFLFNRDVVDGQWNEDESQSHLIDNTRGGWSAKYFTQEGNVYTVNLQKMMADKGFVHLHAIKSAGGNVTVESMVLYGTPLTTSDMHPYSSWTDPSQGHGTDGTYNYTLGRNVEQPFGDASVNAYVDLSNYKKLVITMSAGTPRILMNRTADNGQWNENETQSHLIEYPKDGWINRYFTKEGNTYIVDLEKMVNDKGYAHLHAIKGANWQNVTMENIALYGNPTGNVYARLFVADKTTGEQVADQSVLTIAPPAGWTQKNTNGTDYGYVYYGDASGLKAALNGITVSSSTPLYKGNNTLSLVISSDMTRLNPTNATSASAIVAEPNWEKQYLLDFYKVDEFVGNLKSDGTAIREAVELDNANVTSAQLTKLAAAYSQIASKVNTQGKVYARLFASDDAGDVLDDQSVLSFGDLTSKGWTWKDGYGWIYYGDGFNESLLQGITVSSSMGLPSTGAQVGLVVSSDMARLTPASPGAIAAITKEPNWEVLYLNHFTYPFAGEVKDKFFRHSKEILLTSAEVSAGRTEIPLNEALSKIKSEYVRTNVTDANSKGLASDLHIRWFVTYDGEMIASSENYLTPLVNDLGHQQKTGFGIYWNSATGGNAWLNEHSESSSSEVKNWLNMTFTKPDYGDWSKYKVVIWMSDDTSADNGQTVDGTVLTHEPDINMVYYYSFFVEEEFKFVHSKGAAVEAYPDLPYLIKSSTVQQYDWDNTTSSIVPSTEGDTRQDVHTVIYHVYMDPAGGPQRLKLPFENYFGSGNNLEPAAYIRWYDWATDLGSNKLTAVGTWLEKMTDSDTGNSRGLFALNRDLPNQNQTHDHLGVTYDPSELTGTDIIACDVGKYYDGIYRSSIADTRPGFEGLNKPYMLHEPTLGLRYLFYIHPASDVADAINAGHSSWITGVQGTNGVGGLENGASLKDVKSQLFNNIFEDNGRVVVSLNGSNGTFSLRAGLASLDNYFVNNGNTQCDHITWRAYLEDSQGLWRRDGAVFTNQTTRTQAFTLADISGDYILFSNALNDQEPRKNGLTAAPGMRFHILGFVGGSSGDEQAAIHYELDLIDAPALLVDNLNSYGASINYRRKDYLDTHFNFGGRVSFDEYFTNEDGSRNTTLENQNENHTEMPLEWKDAQYSYCYPQIDQYRIHTGWSGLTPIHGDYILLKSAGGTYSKHMDNSQPYQYFFYRGAVHGNQEEMYDFTYLYGDKTYGGFLYVDASDEARTIAALDFKANLCTGSQIFFTAAIADITSSGATVPQLMIHVYGEDENGNKTAKPIVSFLSCNLNTVCDGSYQYSKWYQLYGHAVIPEGIDVSQYSTFAVDIDNYSKDTNGADFCVDEIRFYTSTGKVNVKMEGGTCVGDEMTFTANIDVEHLENRITLTDAPQFLYYRIYEKTGEENGMVQYRLYPQNAEDYAAIYGRGDNTWTNSYGKVPIYKYVLTSGGELDANYSTQNANYVFQGETLYFDLLESQELKLEQGKTYFIALTKTLDGIQESDLANESAWSNPNEVCSIFSNFFVPRKKFVHFLTIEDQTVVNQIIEGVCGQPTLAHKEYIIETQYPDDMVGFKQLPIGTNQSLSDDGVLFDYYLGTEAELNQNYPGYSKKLVEALQEYRDFERTHTNIYSNYSTELAAEYNGWGNSDEEKETTRTNYAILQDAISKGKLRLEASSHFEDDILYTTTYYAIPVKESYTFYDEDKEENVNYELCNYIPFTFTVNGGFNIPDLTLGFDDVDYTAAGRERIIRVGLEQLNKMKNKGYLLHVPVNMYLDKHRQSFKKLYFPQDSYLTISAVDRDADPLVPNTTDPQLLNDASNAIGKKFAKIVPTISGDLRPAVDKTHMYLALDLSECEIDFHEGYQYEVATNFFDEDDEALNGNLDARACIGDLFLMIKVVPEFVTWKSQKLATENGVDYYSANWYNDDNWQRSVRSELYKDASGNSAKQNTPTEGHPEGYDDNGEGSLDGLTTGSNPGFVPMKFTYVTLPSGEPAPSLINEPRVTGVGVGDRRQGGGFLDLTKTTLLTDRSPRDPDGTPDNQRTSSMPTKNIYYDLLVRYSYKEGDPYGEGCFGHRKLRDDLLNSTDPLTAAQVTAYNNAMANKTEGDILSPVEAKAYNSVISGNGQLNSGVELTANQATAYNAAMKTNKVEGDILTAEEAQDYNSVISGNGQLDSGVGLTAAQVTAYNTVMRKEAGNVLTAAEAHAYNWDNQGTADMTAKVFDCEKYQGNVCHDIYFKPGAELLRQQRLTYKRAWVETELYANRWYLLASPLQSTYAGDMYVPVSMTDVSLSTPATVKGRQVTEAFQPINFSTTATTATSTTTSQPAYSRTLFPIYQRSWGSTRGDMDNDNIPEPNYGKVYVKEYDIRANSYSANLNFSTVSTNFMEWGHTFNDVQVPYHTSDNALANNLAGFSIRAHKKDQTDKVLIRLPKADTTYDYFEWNDNIGEPAATGVKNVSKPLYEFKFNSGEETLFTVPTSYRLVTDEHQHDGNLSYSVDAMQQNDDYLLVGNPYMVSIDMNRFFAYTYDNDNSWKQELDYTETVVDDDNVDLNYCYYTYEVTEENGVVTSELKTCPVTVRYNRTDNKYVPLELNNKIVRPMQGFFVKKGTATDITFNRYMQVDGNFPPEEWNLNTGNNGARSFALTLTAKNGCGRNTASVALSDKSSSYYAGGEDVKTMFDSNFTDVPTVYTVSADGMALSIDTRKELTMVPFGVTCSSEEQVNVQFLMDNGHLYVFDALLGTTTPIGDGENFSVQPNDYGRYYLTTNEKIGSKVTDGVAEGIVVSVRQGGIVTVTSNSQIVQVRAINVNGVTAYGQTDCGTSTTFQLQPGTYVIDVESNAGKQKIKIIVK